MSCLRCLFAVILFFTPFSVFGQTVAVEPKPSETQAFLASDINRDAKLQFAEFKTFVRLMAASGQPTAQKVRFFSAYRFAFGVADKNKDQAVSPEELRVADDRFQAGEGSGHD